MAKAKLPPGPLKVFSENNTTAILDTNGVEVVGWMGFEKSNRTRAEHDLFARELVHRFNAYDDTRDTSGQCAASHGVCPHVAKCSANKGCIALGVNPSHGGRAE